MRYERAACRGPCAPGAQFLSRLARAWYLTMPGGTPWIAPTSSVAAWPAPPSAARHRRSSTRCAATITRPAPATTCATGSQGIRRQLLTSAASWLLCWWAVTPMSPPRNARGRPPGHPSSRPDNAPASAAEEAEGASSAASVRVARRRRQYPLADASRYEPVNGRGREWLSIRCPYCKGVHLARLRPGAKPGGPRRTPCDRVFVVVRRTYAPRVSTPSERAA
jgi:hypothetical protein